MSSTVLVSLSAVGVLSVILIIIRLRRVTIQSLILGLLGAITGLLLGALASVPLGKLPEPYGAALPIVITLILTGIMMIVLVSRRAYLLKLFPFLQLESVASRPSQAVSSVPRVLVDTSVIIDGRIADIATAGFTPGKLLVPRFVLAELQNIADSEDAMRRSRGRRGLDTLNALRELDDVEVEVIDDDVSSIREVDAKLVALALKLDCHVLTTDYNLNKVAAIQGVRVLNVNELSNAIRPVVLPGEELLVRVVQPGKERNQGVGYLADGTMIVVENGDKLIGQEVATEVTRVFQTVAGKMIFATPRNVGGGVVAAPFTVDPTTDPLAEVTPEHVHKRQKPARHNSRGRGGAAQKVKQTDEKQEQPRNHDRSSKSGSVEDRLIELNHRETEV